MHPERQRVKRLQEVIYLMMDVPEVLTCDSHIEYRASSTFCTNVPH